MASEALILSHFARLGGKPLPFRLVKGKPQTTSSNDQFNVTRPMDKRLQLR
jgi:hypothetical protein